MLGARIDVIQPQIRNFITYLGPLPDKKTLTAVVKHDKTSWLDRNNRQKCSRLQRTLLIWKGCYGCVWRCIGSHDYVVYEIMSVHVCKQQPDDLESVVIVSTLSWLVISCGWRMDGTVGGARDGDWVVRMSHFYGSHKGSWKGTATLCRLCVFYCGLCFETYMVVI